MTTGASAVGILLLLLPVRAVSVPAPAGTLIPDVTLPKRLRRERLRRIPTTNRLLLRVILRVPHDRLLLNENFQLRDNRHHLVPDHVVHDVQDAHDGVLSQLLCFSQTYSKKREKV